MKRMEIVHVCKVFQSEFGGVQKIVRQLADISAKLVPVTVISCSKKNPGEQKFDKISLISSRSFGLIRSLPIAPGVVFSLLKKAKKASIVCIHYPFPWADLTVALIILFRLHPKLVVYWHSEIVAQRYLSYLVKPFTILMLKRSSTIVVASQCLVTRSKLLSGYQEKCKVISYGVAQPNVEHIKPRDDGFYLYVGRHVSYKGLSTLIEAWTDLEFQLKIVGEGPLLRVNRQLAKKHGLSQQIEFITEAEDNTLQDLYSRCRALILPSVTPNEAFGLVQIEAMAYSKPIINTKLASAVPWVARDGVEALTVAPNNAKEIARAVMKLESDAGLRKKLGDAGQQRCQECFSNLNYEAENLALYKELF